MSDSISRLPRGYEVCSYQAEDAARGRCETRWRWTYGLSGASAGPPPMTIRTIVAQDDNLDDADTAAHLAWVDALDRWAKIAVEKLPLRRAEVNDEIDARLTARNGNGVHK